jgi:hypothetical protein
MKFSSVDQLFYDGLQFFKGAVAFRSGGFSYLVA